MRIELISTGELGPAEQLLWRRLQSQERTIAAPALSPQWAQCVGAARPDARIAVIEDGRGIVGFLPIQMGRAGVVEPLAASLSLGCGLVGDPRLEWGAPEWLRDIDARGFAFSGVPERQAELARFARGDVVRMCAELHGGAGAYLRRKLQGDLDVLALRGRRAAALAAAYDAPRIRLFACDRADFDRVLYWSAGAYRRPQEEWEIAALRQAFERDPDDGFYGALFTLHVERELAAGAFFLVDRRQAQLVFYGESPAHEMHEPAAVLLVDAISALAGRGVTEADFGAVEGPLVREVATRRRHRLYGVVRPAARRPFAPPIIGRGRRADREWSRLGPAVSPGPTLSRFVDRAGSHA